MTPISNDDIADIEDGGRDTSCSRNKYPNGEETLCIPIVMSLEEINEAKSRLVSSLKTLNDMYKANNELGCFPPQEAKNLADRSILEFFKSIGCHDVVMLYYKLAF